MCFEVQYHDLQGRIGKLCTKSGSVETPLFLPVINPNIQHISPQNMRREFGCEAVISNAYILKRHFAEETVSKGIHGFLGFKNKVVMTDSGAYQILLYGKVEASSEEIVRFQEAIGTDIATILDVPTGWGVSEEHALYTVEETLRRAKSLRNLKTRNDIAWVGPVQGGSYLHLVAKSAREVGKLDFDIHALGSPTRIMEQYLFYVLVDMVLTAKKNLPLERPFHLFGAGHPFMFALAVSLGCDIFDSAAYSIYARAERYMTSHETVRLADLSYLPCSCPACVKSSPTKLLSTPRPEREKTLARHNLYTCFAEVRRVKQALKEGRLWEYLEMKAHGHPALMRALKKLGDHKEYLEKQTPAFKRRGSFFFSSLSLLRPEVFRHEAKMRKQYSPPKDVKTLLLIPSPEKKPYHSSSVIRSLQRTMGERCCVSNVHFCVYTAPFGVVPLELDDVYPLSQHETASPLDEETKKYVSKQVEEYIKSGKYEEVLLVQDFEVWKGKIAEACEHACDTLNIRFELVNP